MTEKEIEAGLVMSFCSYATYFRLTPRHKWSKTSEGYGPDIEPVITFLRSLLPAYHVEDKIASYAVVLHGTPSDLPSTMWDKEMLAIDGSKRRIVHVSAPIGTLG
jgi:hypothetical protein